MKKLLIIIMVMIFLSPGCIKVQPDPATKKDRDISQVPDTCNTDSQVKNPVDSLSNRVIDDSLAYKIIFEFNDIDGNVYHAVKIGDLIWSIENLKTTHYNDGTSIPILKGTSEWISSISGAYCHYNNDASNSDIYGLLYNYYTAYSGKLAPEGWHVATNEEWEMLYMSEVCNGSSPTWQNCNAGVLVNQKDWSNPFYVGWPTVTNTICTNSTGFTALPNGYRDHAESILYSRHSDFACKGVQAAWWAVKGLGGVVFYLDGEFGMFPRDDKPANVGAGI
jgi:uncharacterized protein (TIGR02145 family)